MSVYENTANAQNNTGSRDEEYLLTETEAQLATVLALMTGFSQGCCHVIGLDSDGKTVRTAQIMSLFQ